MIFTLVSLIGSWFWRKDQQSKSHYQWKGERTQWEDKSYKKQRFSNKWTERQLSERKGRDYKTSKNKNILKV